MKLVLITILLAVFAITFAQDLQLAHTNNLAVEPDADFWDLLTYLMTRYMIFQRTDHTP
ncbi:hypothetical protein OHC33_009172 [Knufia fluminis]|uniref:Uncharacterized protein n=1 Tax=Knufia fluminis TaxID=191047 RepID=A0AAN8EQ91_9EURO|nr:hypothetical protein OHC33_009172 [Knufia fluminis]